MDLLTQMRSFTRVVEAGSLSGAARSLRLSLAAVSRQVSSLEREVGARLLSRTTRRLAVTEAGRRYYDHCLRVLRDVEEARASVAEGRAVGGLLTVTAPIAYGLARVVPAVSQLLATHPALRLDLRLEDRVIDLVGEGVDVAIRTGAGPPDSASLVAQVVAQYPRLLVASPAYLRRRGEPRTPGALASHEALVHLPGDGRPSTWRFAGAAPDEVAEPRAVFRSNALLALRDSALRGLGIALLPAWMVEEDIRAHRLQKLLQQHRIPPVEVIALYPTESRGSPRVRALVEQLRASGP